MDGDLVFIEETCANCAPSVGRRPKLGSQVYRARDEMTMRVQEAPWAPSWPWHARRGIAWPLREETGGDTRHLVGLCCARLDLQIPLLGSGLGSRSDINHVTFVVSLGRQPVMLLEPLLVTAQQSAQPTRKHSPPLLVLLGIACALAVVYAHSKRDVASSDWLKQTERAELLTNESGSFVVPPACLYEMAGVALSGTALLTGVVAVVPALGFAEGGVEAESAVAAWQATMGDVEKGSLFATLQSLAARGQLLRILKEGLPLVGNLAVATGAFCSKLDDIEKSTNGAAQAITNMTSAALTQIEHAVQDIGALEQVRKASEASMKASNDAIDKAYNATEDAMEASKDAIDRAYNATKDAMEKAWPWGAVTSGSTSTRNCCTRSWMALAVAISIVLLPGFQYKFL